MGKGEKEEFERGKFPPPLREEEIVMGWLICCSKRKEKKRQKCIAILFTRHLNHPQFGSAYVRTLKRERERERDITFPFFLLVFYPSKKQVYHVATTRRVILELACGVLSPFLRFTRSTLLPRISMQASRWSSPRLWRDVRGRKSVSLISRYFNPIKVSSRAATTRWSRRCGGLFVPSIRNFR